MTLAGDGSAQFSPDTLSLGVPQPPQGTCGKDSPQRGRITCLHSKDRYGSGTGTSLCCHVALAIPEASQHSHFTYTGRLAEHQRGNQVAPHSGRLEYKKEEAKVLVHHILGQLPLFLRLQISHDGDVGTLGRPQRSCTQAQQDRSRDQSVPAKRPSRAEEGISVHPHRCPAGWRGIRVCPKRPVWSTLKS